RKWRWSLSFESGRFASLNTHQACDCKFSRDCSQSAPIMSSSLTVVILAAGKGTRMKSPRPKVLHPLAGRPMIQHVLALAASLPTARAVVVLAPEMADVAAEVERGPLPATIAFQEPQLGTGHALMVARDHLPSTGDVLILYADTPLLTLPTLERLLERRRAADAAVAVL